MKRSYLIDQIRAIIEVHCDTGPFTEKEIAENILDFIEKAGMLPPYTSAGKMTYDDHGYERGIAGGHHWEPEE